MVAGLALPELAFLLVATLGAAIVRGYSGFGFSALMVLLGSWVLDPAQVVPVILLLEIVASLYLLPSVWSHIDWRRLWRLLAGSAVGIPLGVYLLSSVSTVWVGLVISFAILLLTGSALAGVKFQHQTSPWFDRVLGLGSGIMNGLAAIGGMVVASVYLAVQVRVAAMRATLIALFFVTDLYASVFGVGFDLLTETVLVLFLLLVPVLFLGVVIGKKYFRHDKEDSYRKRTLSLLVVLAGVGIFRSLINL